MTQQLSKAEQIRKLCREKYGSRWWDVSPEIKTSRKNEAKKILFENVDTASAPASAPASGAASASASAQATATATAPTYDDLVNINMRLKNVEQTQLMLAAQFFGHSQILAADCCCANPFG
jgi:hypothetical protein